MEYSNRNYWITLFLLILFGYSGIHLLYLGRKKQATIYFLLMFFVLPAIFFYLRDLTHLLTGRLKDGDGKILPSYLDSYNITRFGSKTNMMSKELNKTANKLFQQAKDQRDEAKEEWAKAKEEWAKSRSKTNMMSKEPNKTANKLFQQAKDQRDEAKEEWAKAKEEWAKSRSIGTKEIFSFNYFDLNELQRLIDDIQYDNREDLKVKANELIEFYKKKNSYYVHSPFDMGIKLGDVVMIKDTNEKAKVIQTHYSISKKESSWEVQLLSNGKTEVYPKKAESLELIQMGMYIDLEEEISELITPNSEIDEKLKEDTIQSGFRSRSSYLKESGISKVDATIRGIEPGDYRAYELIEIYIDFWNRRARLRRINKMSKTELKKEAKRKGLKVSGNKKDLSSRLK